jgi:glucose-1-phosphate adenylyltransferase
VPENSVIGYDLDADRAKGFTVSESGVVAVPPSPSSLEFID